MRPIRVVVVDDEKPARRRLLELLKPEPLTQVVGVCATGAEAVRAIEEADESGSAVELVFLDVQMPKMDGFDVLRAMRPRTYPMVIFATAYDQYALRAFDAHAVDYLLKPFSDERFATALGRAVHQLRADGASAVVGRLQSLLNDLHQGDRNRSGESSGAPPSWNIGSSHVDRIALRDRDRVRLLPVEQVEWIEAEGVYVTLHAADGKSHLHRALLGEMEASLDPRRFVRIHRSTMVNVEAVVELRVGAYRDYMVRLRDGSELRLGRTYRERLEERLGQRL